MRNKYIMLLVISLALSISLLGCGGGSSGPPQVVTQILSDAAFDGDIKVPLTGTIVVTQGMTPSVQSVFAGTDPATGAEFRAFLDFPLTGVGGVPGNAVIVSATLDIVIDSIQPPAGTIPIRIDLVSFQPPTLIPTDFDPGIQRALAITAIVPPISPADVGQHVFVDMTSMMMEAQRLGLPDLQIRILEDLGTVSPGLIEINDTTGAFRGDLAPLLQVTYF